MRVLKVPAQVEREVHLYLVGDEHSGTKYHAAKDFKETVSHIKNDPLARWVGMGDKCDFITPSDPRWTGGSICEWVSPDNIALDQANYYCDVVAPIADKCDGMLWGNHEYEIKHHSHIDIHKYICDKLNVRDLSFEAWLIYQFYTTKTQMCRVDAVVTHGAGAGITRGAKMNRLERLMDQFGADIFGHGHVHDIITHPGKPYLFVSKDGKLKQKRKVGAMTGCYFRTYTQDVESSYGERKNYPPTLIGTPMFIIQMNEGDVTISVTA